MHPASFATSLATIVTLSFATATVGCAAPLKDAEPIAVENAASVGEALVAACTPAVIVIRHAEDMDGAIGESCVVGEANLEIPGGTQKVHQRCLTPNGAAHAKLYATHLSTWMQNEKNFCPVGRVVTQDPWGDGGDWPSANPFETIRDFANAEQVPVTFMPSNTVFGDSARRSLLTDSGKSVVISWDKEGMWEGKAPLLRQMTTATTSFPSRDMIYAFTKMNAGTATFDVKEYKQFFQDSTGYFAKVTGAAFQGPSYYRFEDGMLKSNTAYSPDFVPCAMKICGGGGSCDGQGVTLAQAMRH